MVFLMYFTLKYQINQIYLMVTVACEGSIDMNHKCYLLNKIHMLTLAKH